MNYGYARVNTYNANYRNYLDDQICTLFALGCSQVIEEYTLSDNKKPRLDELVSTLKAKDIITVVKLDRLSSNYTDAFKVIQGLISRDVTVNILDIGVIDNSQIGTVIYRVLESLVDFQKNKVIENTCYGKSLAKSNIEFKEGRPKKFTDSQIDNALDLLVSNGGTLSYKSVENITGISKSTLIRENNKRKFKNT